MLKQQSSCLEGKQIDGSLVMEHKELDQFNYFNNVFSFFNLQAQQVDGVYGRAGDIKVSYYTHSVNSPFTLPFICRVQRQNVHEDSHTTKSEHYILS